MGKSTIIDIDRFQILYNQGLSDNKIAKELGCNRKVNLINVFIFMFNPDYLLILSV